MVYSDLRKEAREKLKGKWGKVFWITLICIAVVLLYVVLLSISTTSALQLIVLIFTIISVPLSLAYTISLFKLFNNEDINVSDFFASGFKFFGKSWSITFRIIQKTLVSFILYNLSITFCTGIILGILAFNSDAELLVLLISLPLIAFIILIISSSLQTMKLYYYSLSFIITAENPELSAKEVVEKSKELMTGKRWKLFCLQLSFIGWAILSIFSLGIGFLFLIPYMEVANIAFYKSITNAN